MGCIYVAPAGPRRQPTPDSSLVTYKIQSSLADQCAQDGSETFSRDHQEEGAELYPIISDTQGAATLFNLREHSG